MKAFKVFGTLVIIALVGLGSLTMVNGAIKYLNSDSILSNMILITLAIAGLGVIAYKGIQVIWKV